MVHYRDIITMQALRARDGVQILEGGWHFSYLGGVERIQNKIAGFSHTELDQPQYTDPNHIRRCIQTGADLFGREMHFRIAPLDDRYPRYLLANQARFQHLIAPSTPLAATLYEQALAGPSDIQGHLAYLYRLASTVEHITEFGTRSGQSTTAFLAAHPKRLVCYDRERSEAISVLEAAARQSGTEFAFRQEDVLTVEIEPTDLLFIDTWHVETQMREELRLHADRARRYLVFHDTETFGQRGETPGHNGIWPAICAFMRAHPHWRLLHHAPHHHGLSVFTRIECD